MSEPLFSIEDVDLGQRFVVEKISGPTSLFFTDKAHMWYIVDRNTGEAILGTKQPNGKGARFWRGSEEAARFYCNQWNNKKRVNL
jgi:hypothetical protein